MNDRIKELHDTAFDGINILEANWFLKHNKNFAELIIKECIKICSDVEADTEMDLSDGALACMAEIKDQFGVEE